MSVLARLTGLFGGRGRRSLRRVSPDRVKTALRSGRRVPLPHAGEKLLLAVAFGALATLLVGVAGRVTLGAWVGVAALALVATAFFVAYAVDFRRGALQSVSKVAALCVFLLAPLVAVHLSAVAGLREVTFLPLGLFALPMALVWGRAFALECTLLVAVFLSLVVYLDGERGGMPALATAVAGALVAALSADGLRRRSALVRVGVTIGLVQVLVAGAFHLLASGSGAPGAFPTGGDWRLLVLLFGEGLAIGLVTSGILPAIEALFGVTTDISLLELGNTHEQPLLRKLLLEAPGTFHHSYIVGLISEAAAEAVGGDALLARVGALYHDVGKLNKPGYFAENTPEARERHRELSPEMSTLVISSHTRDGVEIGSYYGLPPQVTAFMVEHHGTCCIDYFYQRAQKLRGEEHVQEEDFRYPGRKPQRVETAIVMIADAVEAISRQMSDPTPTRLAEMVHAVSRKRLDDGQFDECGMTLKDLARIEAACVRVVSGIYHTRPTYPKGRPNPLDLSQPRPPRGFVTGADRPAAERGAASEVVPAAGGSGRRGAPGRPPGGPGAS